MAGESIVKLTFEYFPRNKILRWIHQFEFPGQFNGSNGSKLLQFHVAQTMLCFQYFNIEPADKSKQNKSIVKFKMTDHPQFDV